MYANSSNKIEFKKTVCKGGSNFNVSLLTFGSKRSIFSYTCPHKNDKPILHFVSLYRTSRRPLKLNERISKHIHGIIRVFPCITYKYTNRCNKLRLSISHYSCIPLYIVSSPISIYQFITVLWYSLLSRLGRTI